MGRIKLKSILESLRKPKEKRHEEEFEILGELFKASDLQKKYKFEGREFIECLKRLQLKQVKVGDIIQEEGKEANGFFIIIQGSCSQHWPNAEK